MNSLELLCIALQSLNAHKLRSVLTMLGVAIGIASVIALMAVGEAAKTAAVSEISKLGTNLLFVTPGAASSVGASKGMGTAKTLVYEDAAAIKSLCSAVEMVAAQYQGSFQIESETANTKTQVVGVDLDFPEVRSFHPSQGRFFDQNDLKSCARACLLGQSVARKLFPGDEPAGKEVLVGSLPFTVIGIMESKGAGPMGDSDDQVLIPITTGYLTLFGSDKVTGKIVSRIYVRAKAEQMSDAQFQMVNLLRLRHNIIDEDDDFKIGSQNEILETAGKITGMLSLLLSAIAAISLTVGSIGIMNIMLVTVSERTKEIGIRIAIGASFSDILSQFLAESTLLSVAGGAVGIVCGITVSFGGSELMHVPPSITLHSILLSASLSVVVGVLSGLYPARRAALLDPVEALRS